MGGGNAPSTAATPVQVSRKKEATREEVAGGTNRRALGSQFLQTRKRTATTGGSFGGQNITLG